MMGPHFVTWLYLIGSLFFVAGSVAKLMGF